MSMADSTPYPSPEWTPIRTFTAGTQRVLGVLLEKAFTTPDQYPLTLKAATTGCNQKSNRAPTTDYSEDEVDGYLHDLQELGLVAELHTDGGRALRYRHLLRKRYHFSESQLAILTELWLRGRQQLGELRSRASRMVSIDSLDDLRSELVSLLEGEWIRTSGPLERRGVEVDHAFYPKNESPTDWTMSAPNKVTNDSPQTSTATSSDRTASDSPTISVSQVRYDELENRVNQMERRLESLEEQLRSLLG